jgi:UDP-N-acetylmuramate dehydrogenase
MAGSPVVAQLADFAEIVKPQERLAPFTLLKIGGPAEALVQPRAVVELSAVLKLCMKAKIPYRILGGGGNVLVPDEGVAGVVVRLSAPAFADVTVHGKRVRAGCGASLSSVISQAARHNLAGLEALVGFPGTVGGALRLNAGDRSSDIGQFVRKVEVLDLRADLQIHEHDELRFSVGASNRDDPVLLSAEFQLESDRSDDIVKRLQKAWIQHSRTHPHSFQCASRVFRNPPGLNAATLIDQCGLVGQRVGGAQISDRNANYVIAEPGTSARDVHRLIDLVRAKVEERFHLELDLAIAIW